MELIKKNEATRVLEDGRGCSYGAGSLMTGMGELRAEQKSNEVTTEKEFQPGEKVNTSGIYDVFHDKSTANIMVSIIKSSHGRDGFSATQSLS